MKKALYFVSTLLFLLAVFGCELIETKEQPKEQVFDSRLIGNWMTRKWEKRENGDSSGNESIGVVIQKYSITLENKEWQEIITGSYLHCYTKDGILYEVDTDRPLFKYEMPKSWPNPDYNSGFYAQRIKDGKMIIVYLYNPDGTLHDESITDSKGVTRDYFWTLNRNVVP
jgi:hypothetical protein